MTQKIFRNFKYLNIGAVTWILAILLILIPMVYSDVSSTEGKIRFDIQQDGQPEMTLNSTGLGLGTLPAANLHVAGNAIVSDQLFIGGSSGASNLNINGTIGYGFLTISSNATLGETSVVLVDSSSDNIVVTLPYAGNVTGRQYQIKKISTSNSVWILGGGNLIDSTNPIELPESSNLASVKLMSDGIQWYKLEQAEIFETIASENLVGWWRLDETSGTTAMDSSSDQENGTLQNSLTFATDSIAGKLGNALVFNGSNEYININYDGDLNPSVFTISLWARVNGGAGTFRSPLTSRQDSAGNLNGYIFYASNVDTWQFWTGTGSAYHQQIGPAVVIGEWVFLAGTYDGSTKKFYVNGAAADSDAVTFKVNSLNPTRIGAGGGAALNYYFNGAIDDVRVYNRSLTPNEIQAIYAQGQ